PGQSNTQGKRPVSQRTGQLERLPAFGEQVRLIYQPPACRIKCARKVKQSPALVGAWQIATCVVPGQIRGGINQVGFYHRRGRRRAVQQRLLNEELADESSRAGYVRGGETRSGGVRIKSLGRRTIS